MILLSCCGVVAYGSRCCDDVKGRASWIGVILQFHVVVGAVLIGVVAGGGCAVLCCGVGRAAERAVF